LAVASARRGQTTLRCRDGALAGVLAVLCRSSHRTCPVSGARRSDHTLYRCPLYLPTSLTQGCVSWYLYWRTLALWIFFTAYRLWASATHSSLAEGVAHHRLRPPLPTSLPQTGK